jgi:hypothetical protein
MHRRQKSHTLLQILAFFTEVITNQQHVSVQTYVQQLKPGNCIVISLTAPSCGLGK